MSRGWGNAQWLWRGRGRVSMLTNFYGSRAKGNYKKTSDIDLAVKLIKAGGGSIAKIKSALDDLPVIHEIDAIDEAEIAKGAFKNEYEKTKKIFWKKNTNNCCCKAPLFRKPAV